MVLLKINQRQHNQLDFQHFILDVFSSRFQVGVISKDFSKACHAYFQIHDIGIRETFL